jgi:hypothetical protein
VGPGAVAPAAPAGPALSGARDGCPRAVAAAQRPRGLLERRVESAFIPFVSFGDLDNNTFKGLTSLLSVEQEIQYDEHT